MLKKISKTDILFVITMILLGWNLFRTSKVLTNIEEYNTKIEKLEKDVQLSYKSNDSIYKRIDVIDKEINKFGAKVVEINNNIVKIKTETNEKIIHVDDYTFSDLEKFFSDRYK